MFNSRLISRFSELDTPALVFFLDSLDDSLQSLNRLRREMDFRILFPLKCLSLVEILKHVSTKIDGFAASSLFEATLCREIIQPNGSIHFTSPNVRENEVELISNLCDYASLNSLTQIERFQNNSCGKCKTGLRINTEMSFVSDVRYDPSRPPSKLGMPISAVRESLECYALELAEFDGILVHSNCESEDFGQLLSMILKLESVIPDVLKTIDWINLGGGYLFSVETDWTPFQEAIGRLTGKYGLNVFFEPGRGLVGEAGYIVSSVVDIFESGGKNIAVLDTTVNHMPEVFEYQYKPPVMQESNTGSHRYILAGATCLAGDIFGEYSFDEALEVGTRLVFEDMGAYTLVKANMFNGINLPSIYLQKRNGELELIREFDYQDFLARCGVKRDAAIRKRVYGPQAE